MIFKEKKVPCKFCGELTLSTGTRLCDNCWEFQKRIDCFISNPTGLRFVIRKVKEAKIKEWQDRWHEEVDNRLNNHEINAPVLSYLDVINSIKYDTKFEDWIKKMKELYISDPLCSEIIMNGASNKFLWLDVE